MDPEWMFVFGRSFLAAVPACAPSDLLDALTSRAGDPRVTAEALVGLLPLGGDHALESFALVILADRDAAGDADRDAAGEFAVTVVVRGPIAVDAFSVGGSRRFTDQGIRPWHLADFSDVIGVVIGSPDAAVLPAVPEDSRRGNTPGAVLARAAQWRLVPSLTVAEDTVIRSRFSTPFGTGIGTGIGTADDTVIRTLDDTVLTEGRRMSAEVPDGLRNDGPDTRSSDVSARSEVSDRTDTAGTSAALRPPPARFRLPDGREFSLDRPYRLGRHPVLPRIAAEPLLTLVAVASPGSLVSATHVDIRQVGDVIVVTDTGSRNGTIVVSAEGRRERLRPGDSRTVLPGTTIDIGDDNIIEIIPASGNESAPYFPAHRGRHHP